MTIDRSKEESPQKEVRWSKFRSGITPLSLLAALYSTVVFIPALIYLQLMTGATAAIPVSWFTVLLWVELGKLSGRQVTRQEAFMIGVLASAQMIIPMGMIFNAWYVASPIAEKFDIGRQVPFWAAPPEASGVLEQRTFFHEAWIWPMAISIAAMILTRLLGFGLGLFGREVFIEAEKLPFPIQRMDGMAIVALTGGEDRPIRILGATGMIGLIYGFVLYALPFVMQAWTGVYRQLIPIPWIDLTSDLQWYVPGAMFGVATDLAPLMMGLVLPFTHVLGIFIGSFGIYFVTAALTVAYNMGPEPWWVTGMTIERGWPRFLMYFWGAPNVGLALALGLVPILRHPRVFGRALRSVGSRVRERYTDPISFKKVALPMLIVGFVGYLALFAFLVPEFAFRHFWVFPIMIGTPFVSHLIIGRMIGETGVGTFDVGTVQNISYLASGYLGVDLWFAPSCMGVAGVMPLRGLKLAELTETTATSYIKAYWLLLPIAVFVGYLYLELFWRISPIPSARYPGAAIYWPIQATMKSLWIRGAYAGLFQPTWILMGLLAGLALFLGIDIVHLPISYVAIGAGATSTITPVAFTMLIGGIIAKIATHKTGKEWWRANRRLIGAGLIIGNGLAVTISIALTTILNSLWFMPI